MKTSARGASLIILLFFLFFNGLQVYLIIGRVSEAKAKFNFAGADALFLTLNEYNKLKSIDSAAPPPHALVVYAPKSIVITRLDSQSVQLATPSSTLATDSVDRAFIETVLNSPAFRSIDLKLFNRIYQKALVSKNVHAGYRLDTILMQGKRSERMMIQSIWARKRSKEYPYATRPVRLPYNSNLFVFAQLKSDPDFFRNDLLWPMMAFVSVLLISNAALFFVHKTIRRQKRINEVKTDFINNITHEMKTPITIASAGLQALEHHIVATERTNFYLHTSKRQLLLLNEFVERILDSAVQDIAGFTLKKERIDLRRLFEDLIQSHSVLQAKPTVFRLHGEAPALVLGDRLHLETAFHNIIDNAVKYSAGAVAIDIDIVENSRDCTVKIRDNGMGIPPQFIRHIFDKFFRVPQGDAQAIKGFGLGLYYVSNIVKKHAGTITVQSKQQSGTEFIITLPKQE